MYNICLLKKMSYYLNRISRIPASELISNPVEKKEVRVKYNDYLNGLKLIDDKHTACTSRPNREDLDVESNIWDLGGRMIQVKNDGTTHQIIDITSEKKLANLYMLVNLVILMYDIVQKNEAWDDIQDAYNYYENNGAFPNIDETTDSFVEQNLSLQCWLKPVLSSGLMMLQGLGKIHKNNLHGVIGRLREIRYEMAQQLHAIQKSNGYTSGIDDININKLADPYYLQSIIG